MDIGKIAEAIYKASHPQWRGFIPRSIELQYRRMAEAAVEAMEFDLRKFEYYKQYYEDTAIYFSKFDTGMK